MKLTVGRVIAGLIVLALAAGAVISFWPKPIEVEIVTATVGPFTATVDETGTTRIRNRYVVSAPLAGRLGRVALSVGDHLNAGQTIAEIVPAPAPLLDPRSNREAQEQVGAAEAAKQAAAAAMATAQATASQATADWERTRELVTKGFGSQQQLEHADLAKQAAESELRAAEFRDHAAGHDLDQARAAVVMYQQTPDAQTQPWKLVAPTDGVVLGIAQQDETIVQPGTPILEIGDPTDLQIVADVLTADAAQIAAGDRVTVDGWGGANVLTGTVRLVEPKAFRKVSPLGIEEQRVNVIIDLLSPAADRLRLGDGFQAAVHIAVFSADKVATIPAGALFRVGKTWGVYEVDSGRAQLRQVELLRKSGNLAAIASGIAGGDRVIVFPDQAVRPGVRVAARDQP
jgi:HlyD family secretion protein